MNTRNYSGGVPVAIRLPASVHASADTAAAAMALSKTDVLRLAIEAGLRDLARIDYKIGDAISDSAFALPRLTAADQIELGEAAKRRHGGGLSPKPGGRGKK